MSDSLVVRLTGLALAYAAFTLTIDSSKRPIRKIAESSALDTLGGLLSFAFSLLKASPSPPAEHGPSHCQPAAHNRPEHVCAAEARPGGKVANSAMKQEHQVAQVAVEDLCASCRENWIMVEELASSFNRVGDGSRSCAGDLFQPCTLCSERVRGLSKLEHLLFEQRPWTAAGNVTSSALAGDLVSS
jgi:hypothetical protein